MTPFEHHRAATRERLRASGISRPGPGSVTWKINREVVVLAGWGRAVLLQLAHPAVAAGVHHHSRFRGSLRASIGRLHATAGAMLSLTFGDTEEMIATAAGINAIHDRVRGETYSAHDPDLQRWVHATLLDSLALTYQLLVGPLTVRERDQYCLEATIVGPWLGMPDRSLPRDSAQLDAYMREMLSGGRLAVDDGARALARAVLYPPNWRVVWPAFRFVQLLTIGLLPPLIRDAYGFEWRPRDVRRFACWTTGMRAVLEVLPSLAREWPIARRRDLAALSQPATCFSGDVV